MKPTSKARRILDVLTWPWRILQELDTRSAVRPGRKDSA